MGGGLGGLSGPDLNLDAGGGSDHPLLGGDCLSPTPPSQVPSGGLDGSDNVIAPQDGGHRDLCCSPCC